MPEMPEVEVARLSFAERIAGGTVTGVRLGKPLRWALGCSAESLVDQRVHQVTRRGKYLWISLDRGGLLLHLGMSGSLAFGDRSNDQGKHDHFDLHTTQGTLRLTDPRRFGAVVWSASQGTGRVGQLLTTLGMEPFDIAFDGAYLHAALRRRSVPVKLALLGGRIVVGAGNIYACEALFLAGIDPRLRSNAVSRPRAERLAATVRDVLAEALALGGSTLRDFRDAHGSAGAFQRHARVYGRELLPCRHCGTAVRRIVQAGRSTFFCPTCQRR